MRCSPCPGQVNSVKHREEGSCTRRIALGAPRCCEALRLFERIRYLGCSSVGRCTTCPRRSEECGAQTLCAVVATHRLLPLGIPPCPREAAAWTRDAPEREKTTCWDEISSAGPMSWGWPHCWNPRWHWHFYCLHALGHLSSTGDSLTRLNLWNGVTCVHHLDTDRRQEDSYGVGSRQSITRRWKA